MAYQSVPGKVKGKSGPVYFRSWVCHINEETRVHSPTFSSPGWARAWLAAKIYASGTHGSQKRWEVGRELLLRTQPGTSFLVQPLTVWWLRAVADGSKAISQSQVCWSHSLVCSYYEQWCYDHQWTSFCVSRFSVVLGIYIEGEMLDYMAIPCFILWGVPYCFTQWLQHLTFLSARPEGFKFSTSSLVIFQLFDRSHPFECEVLAHCGFHFHFPNDYWWLTFSVCVLIGLLYTFFGVYSNPLPIFRLGYLSFYC